MLTSIESRRPWYERFFGDIRVAELSPGFAVATAVMVLAAGLMIQQHPENDPAPKIAAADSVGVEAGWDYFEEIDRAFEDMEMLADFDALALEEKRADRS